MTAAQKLAEIKAKKQKRWQATRRKLMGMAGVGATGRPANRGFTDRSSYTAGGLARTPEPQFEGQMNVRRGYMPDDTTVSKYATMQGASEDARDIQELQAIQAAEAQATASGAAGGAAAATGSASASNLPPELQAYLADVKAKDEAAFADTQARIKELREGHAGKRDRVLARVENFGKARATLNEEKAAEALKRQRAFLAMKGLSNSNDLPAWMARNARDLALEQQALAESVDDRAIRYDTSLSNDYLGAIERINNVPPQMGQALDLALKYGASGDGQGYAAVDAELGRDPTKTSVGAGSQGQQGMSVVGARDAARLARGMYGQFHGSPQQSQQPMYVGGVGPVVDEQPPVSKRIGPDGMTTVQRRVMKERLRRADRRRRGLQILSAPQVPHPMQLGLRGMTLYT